MRRGVRHVPLLALPLVVAAISAPIAIAAVVNVSMGDNFFQPQSARALLGDRVVWTNNGVNPHNAASTNANVRNPNGTRGVGLWRGAIVGTGGKNFHDFKTAGRFPYYCEVHGTIMTGTISVPLRVTKAVVSSGTQITVRWATAPPPSGLVFDVQRRPPGSTTFQNFRVGVTTQSASFVTNTPGTWSFRSRVRRPATGGVSLYSPVRSVTV
jgi:plastocyanin